MKPAEGTLFLIDRTHMQVFEHPCSPTRLNYLWEISRTAVMEETLQIIDANENTTEKENQINGSL